ncbi:hypothetical protein [Mucilaginibacter sp. SP1R1]|uniref:hypothetical protein n=1 Tax=Mucilaginibacter sp. SP1R1 TaxID=2723091 RepID=UPI003B00A4C8
MEEFFSAADKIIHEDIHSYHKLPETIEQDKKSDFIGATLFKLANLKRKFEIEVLEVLKYTYPEVFKELNKYILDFEDAGSAAFDELSADDAYFKYITTINKTKARLLILLSEPALKYRRQKAKEFL